LYIITDWLATHGLDWQFDDSLPEDMILQPDASRIINGYKVFDIRTRLMDAPTDLHVYRRLVIESTEILKSHGKIVVCCSAGVSRSNSIAIALLMKRSRMSFRDAFNTVKIKVPIANPLSCHLEQIQQL
jgi:predicted protein tyrosine phosphatase